MLKAIIFDLDDTLYPEKEYALQGLQAVADQIKKRYGFLNPYASIKNLFEIDKDNVINRFFDLNGIQIKPAEIVEFIKIYHESDKKIQFYSDVLPTLSYLKKNHVKLGILTDGKIKNQNKKLIALKCKIYFDEILISDSLGGVHCRKPSEIPFREISHRLGVKYSEMVYVGDNPKKDFLIGKVGIKTIEIKRQDSLYKNEAYLENYKPNMLIESLSEILENKMF